MKKKKKRKEKRYLNVSNESKVVQLRGEKVRRTMSEERKEVFSENSGRIKVLKEK